LLTLNVAIFTVASYADYRLLRNDRPFGTTDLINDDSSFA
jgi:hypothetical protein